MATCEQSTSLKNSVVYRCTLKHESEIISRLYAAVPRGMSVSSPTDEFLKCLSLSCQWFGEVAAAAVFLGLWIFGQLDGQNLCCTNP